MNTEFLIDNIVLLGPGFIFVKVVYLFGEQHRRLEWEWIVWSILASLPIAALSDLILAAPIGGPVPLDVATAVTRFTVAIVGGIAVAYFWRRYRHASNRLMRFVRHSLSDSAWDLVLDNALREGCGVAITTERIDDNGHSGETSFYGRIATFGYETAGAEPIVFLKDVSRWDAAKAAYVHLGGDERDGMLFHRSQIRRVRIWAPRDEPGSQPD